MTNERSMKGMTTMEYRAPASVCKECGSVESGWDGESVF